MPEEPYDNPAARLHALLVGAVSNPAGESVELAWRRTLDLDTGERDPVRFLQAFAAVCALPSAALARLESTQRGQAPHFSRWLAPVVDTLESCASSLGQRTDTALQRITPEVLVSLESAAWLLHDEDRRALPPRDVVAALLAALEELEAQLLAATDVDETLREYLLLQVAQMMNAVRLVRVVGADGLQAAYERGVGASLVAVRRHGPSAWLDKFLGVVVQLEPLVSVGADLVAIASPTIQAIAALPH